MPADIIFQPRTLLDITAELFANSYYNLVKSRGPNVDPEVASDYWTKFPPLPTKVGTYVYKYINTKNRKQKYQVIRLAAIMPYTKSFSVTLSELDITGLALTDNTLANLLTAQQRTLRCLKAWEIDGISVPLDMFKVCRFLKEQHVVLSNMRYLSVNQLKLIVPPKHTPCLKFYDPNLDSLSIALDNALPSTALTENLMDTVAIYPALDCSMPHLLSFMPGLQSLKIDLDGKTNIAKDAKETDAVLNEIFQNTSYLRFLDICAWPKIENCNSLSMIAQSLTHLSLSDMTNLETMVDQIGMCHNLIVLDVSHVPTQFFEYQKPNQSLFRMVKNMARLEYLDLSGTNLHMTGNSDDVIDSAELEANSRVVSDIIGLRALHKPLRVLGLYGCEQAGCLPNLPADRVFSACDEDQLICALEVYEFRLLTLHSVMNDVYQFYRFSVIAKRAAETLDKLLELMRRYPNDIYVVTAATAAIFYLLRKVEIDSTMRRYVAKLLVDALEVMHREQVVVRNIALTLCQFEFTVDVLKDYGRIILNVLRSMKLHKNDNFTRRVIIFLMNAMACYLDVEQRTRVGELGAVEVIMNEIVYRRELLIADRGMEACWSFLWNITDEVPANSERFINKDGIKVLFELYEYCPNEEEIVRNMMGLLGNISETHRFRPRICCTPFTTILCRLLGVGNVNRDNMEVTYNVAAVMAHLLSDGIAAWKTRTETKYKDAYNRLVAAVKQWDVCGVRVINYHSLSPIIGLLYCTRCYASQLWAAWALANLLSTDHQKYAKIFVDDGGMLALQVIKSKFPITSRIFAFIIKIEEKVKASMPDVQPVPFIVSDTPEPVEYYENVEEDKDIEEEETTLYLCEWADRIGIDQDDFETGSARASLMFEAEN